MAKAVRYHGIDKDVVVLVILIHDFSFPMKKCNEILPRLGDPQLQARNAVHHHVVDAMNELVEAFSTMDGDKNGICIKVAF